MLPHLVESLNHAHKDPSDISGAEKYFNQTLDADSNGLVDVSEIVQWVRKVEVDHALTLAQSHNHLF